MKRNWIAAMVLATACASVSADVQLASVFGDHMVLQRDKAVKVWGTAEAGKNVTVKIGDKSATAKAGTDGKWTAEVAAGEASEKPVELVVSEEGGNTVTVSDVLLGDVWICSGQSNMEFGLPRASNAAEAIPAATDDKIRLLVVPHAVSDTPLQEQKGTWVVCSPDTAKTFSAVGYFFGKEIREKEQIPVGLIGTYWGGTPAEAWTPPDHLKAEEWTVLWDKDKQMLAEYPAAKEKYDAAMKEWESKGDKKARKPAAPRGATDPHRPAVLWNGMVQPLVPMSITGVIWYQGENNAGRAEQYRTLFPNMITGWRDQFGQGEVPFLFVQLANFGKTNGDTEAGSAWAELREAQAMTLKKLPKTGMAVTIDVGNPTNIHPTDKETVGKRLATSAESVAYGKKVQASGPTYRKMSVNGNEVTLTFGHAKVLKAKDDAVKGFTIAGADKKFVPAEAKIVEKNKIVLSAESVKDPVAVRYAWADNPDATVYNGAGLPAVPFRTDDWDMVTAGKK